MIIGELYLVKENFWFLYPTKELAERSVWAPGSRVAAAEAGGASVVATTKYLSVRYNVDVSFFEPNTYIVVLEVDEDCYKLLDSNGNIGWIYCFSFSKFFELVKVK